MKKLFVMAAMVLSSVGAFAQQAAGTTTIQPKVGLNVSTIGDGDWKAGFAAGAELQYQASDKLGLAVGALYSAQGTKSDHVTWTPGYINVPVTLNYYVAQGRLRFYRHHTAFWRLRAALCSREPRKSR